MGLNPIADKIISLTVSSETPALDMEDYYTKADLFWPCLSLCNPRITIVITFNNFPFILFLFLNALTSNNFRIAGSHKEV